MKIDYYNLDGTYLPFSPFFFFNTTYLALGTPSTVGNGEFFDNNFFFKNVRLHHSNHRTQNNLK